MRKYRLLWVKQYLAVGTRSNMKSESLRSGHTTASALAKSRDSNRSRTRPPHFLLTKSWHHTTPVLKELHWLPVSTTKSWSPPTSPLGPSDPLALSPPPSPTFKGSSQALELPAPTVCPNPTSRLIYSPPPSLSPPHLLQL